MPSLMRRKPLDLNPSRTPLNTNLTCLTQTQGGVKEYLQVLLGFLRILDFFMMICLTLVGGHISTPALTAMADFRPS